MGTKTGIEWTDATWNPIRGCSRVSEGCRNCYAERLALRFSGAGQPYEGLAVLRNGHASWTGKIEFVEKHLLDPLKWKTARRIFVNSMSDLFHENVTDEMRDKIFAVMALCPQHTFQVLTKRPERMLAYLRMIEGEKDIQRWINAAYDSVPNLSPCWAGAAEDLAWPLPNVQLGVSVESDKVRERVRTLLQVPAAKRFLSCEPLIGELSLRWMDARPCSTPHPRHKQPAPDVHGRVSTNEYDGLRELDWVICGGESGRWARPMHPDWARSLRDQCQAAGVPFFFKQWGEWIPISEMTEAESQALYVSNKKAPEEWQQPDFDEVHGRRCKVPVEYMNFAGELGLARGFHMVDGHSGMTFFGVGKHAAGALLDGVEHKAFPEARA